MTTKQFLTSLTASTLILSASLYADPSPRNQAPIVASIESQVRLLSIKVNANIQRNSGNLSNYDLQLIKNNLRSINQVINGMSPSPTPSPRPYPLPRPRPFPGGNNGPYPTPAPYPRQINCSMDQGVIYQNTFSKIKAFAYSGNGLNKSSQGAKNYALSWTEQYPCNFSAFFIDTVKSLKSFAYSGNGLNKSSRGAIDFALKNVFTLCTGYNYKSEFRSSYQFAYSGNGLNMSTNAAKTYALNKIKSRAFSCDNSPKYRQY